MKFDLEERTIKFSESIIILATKVRRNVITLPIVSQLVRSGTSVGANYAEANNASSRKDFRNKISISKKEMQETRYWLRVLCAAQPELKKAIEPVADEARQLTLILNKVLSTTDKNSAIN